MTSDGMTLKITFLPHGHGKLIIFWVASIQLQTKNSIKKMKNGDSYSIY